MLFFSHRSRSTFYSRNCEFAILKIQCPSCVHGVSIVCPWCVYPVYVHRVHAFISLVLLVGSTLYLKYIDKTVCENIINRNLVYIEGAVHEIFVLIFSVSVNSQTKLTSI